MKSLHVSNNNAVSRTHSTLRCLVLLGVAIVSACTSESVTVVSSPAEHSSAVVSSPIRSGRDAARYHLTPGPLHEAPLRQQESLPYRLLASGSEGARFVDESGGVIRPAAPGGTIFGAEMSADRQWVLMYFGGGKYSVASAGSLEDIVRPPITPDGFGDANVFSWFILDNDRLIGQADLPALETEGLTASEKESLPPRDTLIYVFIISSGTMMPVEIDKKLSRPFHITEASDSHVTLLHDITDKRMGASLRRLPAP